MGLIILYFLGALSLSFLCSVLEAVLLSTPMSFISMKENQGNKTASLMKQYKNNVDRPVGAILSLNTIAHTSVLPAWVPSLSNSLAKNTSVSFPPFSPCWFWCFQKSSRRPSVLLTGARWQCHPPRLSGYSSSSPTLWYCSQNLSQRYSRLRATRLPWAAKRFRPW